MSEENNLKSNKQKQTKKKKKGKFRGLKIFLLTLVVLVIIGSGIVGGIILSIVKDTPKIDPTNINESLDQTSFILDPEGELIEKIQAPERRTVVTIDKMPKHLKDAFISIEDERFESHRGIDPRGIIASAADNLKAGRIVRGASTITQQLVKNVYLTNEKSYERKIKEAYLAMKVEKVLSKDQILELYLNRIFLGQNAYGVQEASQTYFEKDVEDLTIAEAALIAGVAKSSESFAPYKTIRPENFDPDRHDEITTIDLAGEKYVAIYNPKSIERQQIVLNQMLNLGKISNKEYSSALNENIRESLKPSQRADEHISSYFLDYVKTQVIETLVEKLDYTEEDAKKKLYTGGLRIFSTVDVNLQNKLENTYNNFVEVLMGNPANLRGPVLINWTLNSSRDVVENNGKVLYYAKNNVLNSNSELIIKNGSFNFDNGNLSINSDRLRGYKKHIDTPQFYVVDDSKNLVSYHLGSISLPEESLSNTENGEIIIKKPYLDEHTDFCRVDTNGDLLISPSYFYIPDNGIVQPQSAAVVLDYKHGHIKALVGGRDIEGSRMLNRATESQRQPGSVMKTIATFFPALDNGWTAASVIDDIPFYSGGKLWPKNWYRDYRGIQTVRKSVEQSGNVTSVKLLNSIGVNTSMKYLEKMGIINNSDPFNDSFVPAKEDPRNNDENLSALALGGMTRGLTPLEVTQAFGTIANNGTFIEPMSFFKIEDKNGNILIEDFQTRNEVVSPQKAFIMKDILNTTVTNGIARRAQVPNMATGGKTGTTQNSADIWFAGFTPYYASTVWIGNDSPAITMSQGSSKAAELWKHIMIDMHEGLPAKTTFDRPDGIVSMAVCRQSGMKPSSLCSQDARGSQVYTEIFASGTEPRQTCKAHVSVAIDSASGLVATENCPDSNIVNRVFVKRSPAYNPADHGGITPTDYSWTAPTRRCNLHDSSTPQEDPDLEEIPDDFPLDDSDDDDLENKDDSSENGSDKKPDKPVPEKNDTDKDKPPKKKEPDNNDVPGDFPLDN